MTQITAEKGQVLFPDLFSSVEGTLYHALTGWCQKESLSHFFFFMQYIQIFLKNIFHMGYYKIFSMVLCAIQ